MKKKEKRQLLDEEIGKIADTKIKTLISNSIITVKTPGLIKRDKKKKIAEFITKLTEDENK